jgi:hypothetical protein
VIEPGLAVPLAMIQIEAANRLHAKLVQWQVTDQALHTLQENLPGFDIEATLLKVVAINQLYGTNVYAVTRMAQHITKVMPIAGNMEDVDLVEELASLSGWKHLSFASKFAHFFIDMERFPIYDTYAVKMVTYHLGKQEQDMDTAHPYRAFVENIHRLKRYAQLSCTTRELDRYLWQACIENGARIKPRRSMLRLQRCLGFAHRRSLLNLRYCHHVVKRKHCENNGAE